MSPNGRDAGRRRRGWLLPNLAVSFGSILVVFVGGEAICRTTALLQSTVYRQTGRPDLAFDLIPGARVVRDGVPIEINQAGFRDHDYARDRRPGTVRIAVVGDSVAFGARVAMEQTYAKHLERLLNSSRSDTAFEVLNFGMEGLNTATELVVLREKVLPFRPDVVILGYFLNDLHDAGFEDLRLRVQEQSRLLGLFLQSSCLAFYVASKANVALSRWRFSRDVTSTRDYYQRVLGLFVEGGAHWETNKRELREFASIVRKEGARLVLAVFPFLEQTAPGSPRMPQQMLERFAREEAIPVVDIARGFEPYEARRLYLAGDNIHLSPQGHQAAAEVILRDLHPLMQAWGTAKAAR